MKTLRQGTIGKPFLVHTRADLTGATGLTLRFVEPDMETFHDKTTGITVTPAVDDGTGDLNFVDTEGMFPAASDVGIWRVIAIFQKAGSTEYSFPAGRFRVTKALS